MGTIEKKQGQLHVADINNTSHRDHYKGDAGVDFSIKNLCIIQKVQSSWSISKPPGCHWPSAEKKETAKKAKLEVCCQASIKTIVSCSIPIHNIHISINSCIYISPD